MKLSLKITVSLLSLALLFTVTYNLVYNWMESHWDAGKQEQTKRSVQ